MAGTDEWERIDISLGMAVYDPEGGEDKAAHFQWRYMPIRVILTCIIKGMPEKKGWNNEDCSNI